MSDRPSKNSESESPATTEVREIRNLEAMRDFAREVVLEAAHSRRLLILLDGEMGAGKTQFTRYLIEEMGSDEACSPSFAIHNSYQTSRGPVEHMDLYRLENEDDLESTGFWDFFLAGEGLVIIEWAGRLREMGLEGALPRTWPKLEIKIEHGGTPEERVLRLRRISPA